MTYKYEQPFLKRYETERLYLRIVDETYTDAILTFLNQGAGIFDEYEAEKPSDYYTRATQQRILLTEQEMASQKTGVRFYVFKKDNPKVIIGTVSVFSIFHKPSEYANLGYKFLPEHWHQGYATEALKKVIELVGPIMKLKYLEAYVLPVNLSSRRLLARLGFDLGERRLSKLEIKGAQKDHFLYRYNYKKTSFRK